MSTSDEDMMNAVLAQNGAPTDMFSNVWGTPQLAPGVDLMDNTKNPYLDAPRMIGGKKVSAPWYAQQEGVARYNQAQADKDSMFALGNPAFIPAFLLAAATGANALGGAAGGAGALSSESASFAAAPELTAVEAAAPEFAAGAGAGAAGAAGGAGAFGASGIPWAAGSAALPAAAPSVAAGGIGALSAGVPGLAGAGAGATAGASALLPEITNVAAPSGGFWSNVGGALKNGFKTAIHNPDGSINIGNALKLGSNALGAIGVLTGAGQQKQPEAPGVPEWFNTPAAPMKMTRERTAPITDYANYGKTGGEHKFFTDPVYTRADGGRTPTTGTGGRKDDINALLSEGEYVMDAETVSMLGNGSTEAGSRRLDELRANLRKHKGAAMAKGKFTPDAKHPIDYLGKAEGGNVQLGVRDLPPVNSSDPAPLPNAGGRYAMDDFEAPQPYELPPELAAKLQLDQLAQKVLGGTLTEREAQQLLRPRAKAKGGRIRGDWVRGVIQGAGGMAAEESPEVRLAKLQAAQRMAAELRAQQPPVDEVTAARQRLARIKALSGTTPIQKAEGGSVKALSTFADKLEEALTSGDQSRLTQLNSQMEGAVPGSSAFVKTELAKGGRVGASIRDVLMKLLNPDIPTPPMKPLPPEVDLGQLAAYLKAHAPDSPVLDKYNTEVANQKGYDILTEIRNQRAQRPLLSR